MSNHKLLDTIKDESPIDVSTEVNFIWSIANTLRGPYREDKYRDVIIPMVIIRRFECALADTKSFVVKNFKENPNYPAKMLCHFAKYPFYNISEFTLAELLNDAEHLLENIREYIASFSENVRDIISNLDFDKQLEKMNDNNRLYSVVKAFSELDLNPKTIDNVKMGYIFEDLIRRFSENAEAGDHYTGRDIIKTMVSILLAEGAEGIFKAGRTINILDQACGTGGMLSTSYNYIKRYNKNADITLYGQEINPESYAICLAEMLIKGQNAGNIRKQNTMIADCFANTKMNFVIENPPFGTSWSNEAYYVKEEFKNGFVGRWGAGLPKSNDSQLLFVQSALDKLNDNGRCAIIENGSPLFTGATASGESQIRLYLLTNDFIEAIIALPTDLFYNTGIATYIWILSKNKSDQRKGKVQLIDASNIYHKLRKSLGNKRNEITAEDRAAITKLYADFSENELSKIYPNEEFMYREYSVMQPLQRNYQISEERIAKVNTIKDVTSEVLNKLEANISDKVYKSPSEFIPVLTKLLAEFKFKSKKINDIAMALSKMDKTAEIHRDKQGNIIYDKETKDTEIVKYQEDIDDYMKREVLPHIPDAKAFFEEDLNNKKPVIKTGAEIPFTRYFYKYQEPISSEELKVEFLELDMNVQERIAELFE